MADSNIREFKWSECRDAKRRFAAERMIDFLFANLAHLRVDVVLWDTHDSRHAIAGRSDEANLGRMYYKLFKNVAARGGIWTLRPDDSSVIDWDLVDRVLAAGVRPGVPTGRPLDQRDLIAIGRDPLVERLSPCDSSSTFIQLADLLCGLSVYSRSQFEMYRRWRHAAQGSLFESALPAISKAHEARCSLVHTFDQRCKDAKLGVSLETHGGLRSLKPGSPINIWWYKPQHSADKAPVRKSIG